MATLGNIYYALAIGDKTGVFKSYLECKTACGNAKDPVYKKFNNQLDAQVWLNQAKNGGKYTNWFGGGGLI